jgi:hypothetical protein
LVAILVNAMVFIEEAKLTCSDAGPIVLLAKTHHITRIVISAVFCKLATGCQLPDNKPDNFSGYATNLLGKFMSFVMAMNGNVEAFSMRQHHCFYKQSAFTIMFDINAEPPKG